MQFSQQSKTKKYKNLVIFHNEMKINNMLLVMLHKAVSFDKELT